MSTKNLEKNYEKYYKKSYSKGEEDFPKRYYQSYETDRHKKRVKESHLKKGNDKIIPKV